MEKAKCRVCGIEKNKDDFTPDIDKRTSIVRFCRCKECMSIKSRTYHRTIDGVISLMFSRQKRSSIVRNMPQPEYTKQELAEYLKSNLFFQAIYDEWVASGHNKWLRPSVDRINDFLPYSFGNIIVNTWKDNFDKSKNDLRLARGTVGLYCKAILQYTMSGEFIAEFISRQEAQRITKINGIAAALNKADRSAGGYRWRYKQDIEKDKLMQVRITQRKMQEIIKKGRKPADVSKLRDTTNYI